MNCVRLDKDAQQHYDTESTEPENGFHHRPRFQSLRYGQVHVFFDNPEARVIDMGQNDRACSGSQYQQFRAYPRHGDRDWSDNSSRSRHGYRSETDGCTDQTRNDKGKLFFVMLKSLRSFSNSIPIQDFYKNPFVNAFYHM
ncbi:UNVERIFIED_CONTAM: hypothetical protein ABIC26_003230 [Paenibacillus sp. PvR008]